VKAVGESAMRAVIGRSNIQAILTGARQKRTFGPRNSMSALPPEGRHRPSTLGCPLSANSETVIDYKGCLRISVRQWSIVGPINRWTKEEHRVQVFVRDNNVDQALRALKKKMQREGVFREMKLRKHYEKPSEKRVREKAEAVRRARKLARKKLQREGLLPIKPRVVQGTVGRGRPARSPRF